MHLQSFELAYSSEIADVSRRLNPERRMHSLSKRSLFYYFQIFYMHKHTGAPSSHLHFDARIHQGQQPQHLSGMAAFCRRPSPQLPIRLLKSREGLCFVARTHARTHACHERQGGSVHLSIQTGGTLDHGYGSSLYLFNSPLVRWHQTGLHTCQI